MARNNKPLLSVIADPAAFLCLILDPIRITAELSRASSIKAVEAKRR